MGSCGSNQQIIKQIKAQDEQLEHLINLNSKLTEYLNCNNSKLENSTEAYSPEFRQYKGQIDDRFSKLEKQVSEIYFKLRKLNIFENEIPEFTEIVEADINSFEQALAQSDFRENNCQTNNNEHTEQEETNLKNGKIDNINIKKPPRQSNQQQCASKNKIKRLRQKLTSSASNQLSEAFNQQNNKHKYHKSTQKMNLNSDDFIKLTKNSKLSDYIKEESNEQKVIKKDFEKKKSKESQKN